jgi:hypothetical protein
VLAYVFWHRPARGVHQEEYERSLARFHHSLAGNPPSGFASSVTLRAPELPWLAGEGIGYEDWYLVENWTAIGVLEAAAVSRGHVEAHDSAAHAMGRGAGAVYRLLEGAGPPEAARLATWVTRPPDSPEPQIAELLGDGLDPARSALYQRCLLLGPAPELCLLSAGEDPGAETGLAAARLPADWSAGAGVREPLVA